MHADLNSRLSVPIHFGTFVNRDEVSGADASLQPLADHIPELIQMLWSVEILNKACEQADVPLRRCSENWSVRRDKTRSSSLASAFALVDIGRGVSIASQ